MEKYEVGLYEKDTTEGVEIRRIFDDYNEAVQFAKKVRSNPEFDNMLILLDRIDENGNLLYITDEF